MLTCFLAKRLESVVGYRPIILLRTKEGVVSQKMMIGKIAKISGLGIETIRFYERRGLLNPPSRRESGYREYNDESVSRLTFIKKAKDLGFSLDEISELLSLKANKESHCQRTSEKATKKLEATQGKIQELKHIESALKNLIEQCKKRETTDECPILQSLEGRET
jgi:Hg(II)-responsive transcriptional regulator